MRTFNVLDVAYMDDDDVVYDKTTSVSVTNDRLLKELQRQLQRNSSCGNSFPEPSRSLA